MKEEGLPGIGIGCEQLGGHDWGKQGEIVSEIIEESWEKGIRIYDTAPAYGLGRSEVNLSNILGNRRHEALISTKCGLKWKTEKKGRATITVDNSSSSISEDIYSSLKRLRIDKIPLLFLHRKDKKNSLKESLDCLYEFKERGIIERIGLSNHDLVDYEIAFKKYDIDFCQIEINYLNRKNIEIVNFCEKSGIQVMSSSSLARGILTNKYLKGFREFDENDRRSRLESFSKESYKKNLKIVSHLALISKDHGYTVSAAAIRWILDVVGCSHSLVGFKNINQFYEVEKAIDHKLPNHLIDLMERELNKI